MAGAPAAQDQDPDKNKERQYAAGENGLTKRHRAAKQYEQCLRHAPALADSAAVFTGCSPNSIPPPGREVERRRRRRLGGGDAVRRFGGPSPTQGSTAKRGLPPSPL